jgi:hypothetical protein
MTLIKSIVLKSRGGVADEGRDVKIGGWRVLPGSLA